MTDFAWDILEMMLKGHSGLDLRSVPFETHKDAEHFLRNYGFNWQNEADQHEMHLMQKAALDLIQHRFLVSHADWDHFWSSDAFQIPRDFKHLDLPDLMLKASAENLNSWEQNWACAVLKIMHLMCHIQNSFYAKFLEEAREQIMGQFQACLFNDLKTGRLCLGKPDDMYLPIVDFQVKNAKTLDSTIIKLICKKESIAEQVLDLLGVRIITETPSDAVLALEILRRNRVVIFANLIPHRSRNTLIDVDAFVQLAKEIQHTLPSKNEPHAVQSIVNLLRNIQPTETQESFKKHNKESHDKYRSIHLTARQLIRGPSTDGSAESRIFFPFELQLVDRQSDMQNKSGDSAHNRYKQKKMIQARRRILASLLALYRQQRREKTQLISP